MRKITDFLPKPKCTDKILVQAKIPTDLHEATRAQIDRDKKSGIDLNWNSLFEAACRSYLTERGAKNVP